MSGSGTALAHGTSSKSGRTSPGRSRGRGRHVRFAIFNVLYDSEGQEYPVDDYGQIYVQLESEHAGGEEQVEDEKEKIKKPKKNSVLEWSPLCHILFSQCRIAEKYKKLEGSCKVPP